MTDLVVTQLGEEVAFIGSPAIVVTQLGVEVAYNLVPSLVITQVGIEVAFVGSAVAAQNRVMVMA